VQRPNQIDDRQLKQMLMTSASGTECFCLEVFLVERRSRCRGDAKQRQFGKAVNWIEFRRFGMRVVVTTVNIHTESLKHGCWNSRSAMDA
jgi:hypothetical protein